MFVRNETTILFFVWLYSKSRSKSSFLQ